MKRYLLYSCQFLLLPLINILENACYNNLNCFIYVRLSCINNFNLIRYFNNLMQRRLSHVLLSQINHLQYFKKLYVNIICYMLGVYMNGSLVHKYTNTQLSEISFVQGS